jgi:hypothetical protein
LLRASELFALWVGSPIGLQLVARRGELSMIRMAPIAIRLETIKSLPSFGKVASVRGSG